MKHLAPQLLSIAMLALLPLMSVAQTNVYSCDFEDATENSEWLLLGGTFPNQWAIDVATNNGGSNALYISNDGGTSFAYTVATQENQFVFAMRSLSLEVGEYVISYDWRCNGQGNSDYLRVALVPESIAVDIDAAQSFTGLSHNTMPAGWIALDGNFRLAGSNNWARGEGTASVTADGEYSLVFIWHNNKSGGSQSPAAVDNISISRNDCMSPANLRVTNLSVHEATLSWNGAAGAYYELRYSTVDDVATATPYPNTDSAFSSATLTGLDGSTTYYAWVRATCNDEWVAFQQFTTPMACAPVTGARVERVDRNNALISWHTGTGAAYEQTGVVVMFGSDSSNMRTLTTTSEYIILTGLTSATTYTAKIMTVCDSDTASAVTVAFSTPGCENLIGTQSATSSYTPTNTYYNYSYTQSLYPNSVLNGIDTIFGFYWYVNNESCTANRDVKVYVGNTSLTSLSTSNYVSSSNLTQVYNGQLHTLNSAGTWIHIPFSTPFVHTPGSNMVIALQDNTGTYESSGNRVYFSVASLGSSVYWYQDSPGSISISSPSATNSSTASSVPILQLEIHCNEGGCYAPMIVVDEVTSNEEISVHWGDPQDGSLWRVEYKPASSDTWILHDSLAAEPYAIFSELEPNTAYDIRVGSLCAGTEPAYTSVQARTLCGMYDFPYAEYFDDGGALNCWILDGQQFNPAQGSGSLSNSLSGSHYAILPDIEVVLSGLQLNFDLRTSSTTAYVIVGVVTDTDNPDGTFTAISDTIRNSDLYTFYTHELPVNYFGPEGRLAFKINSGSTTLYIDNVRLINPPTCFKVDDVDVTGISTTYATIHWSDTVNLAPQAYAVRVGDSLYIAAASPLRVNGLDSNATYIVTVSAICSEGDTSEATYPISFHTLAVLPSTVPFVETFENPSTHAGWQFVNGSYTNKWYIGTATNNGGTHAMYVGNSSTSNTYSTSYASEVFAYRDFTLEAGNYILSYDWKCNGESSYSIYDFMRVALIPMSVSLTTGWSSSALPTGAIALDGNEALVLQSNWQTMDLDFDITQSDNYRLVFYWKNDGSQGSDPPAAVDNIQFRLNSCPAPSNLTVNNVTATTAQLSWSQNGNETMWIVSNGIVTDTAYSTSYVFDSLEPSTTYQFSMWAYCGDNDESNALTASATTLCQALSQMPYNYGFEDVSGSSFNNCYDRLTNITSDYPYATTTSYRSGSHGACFYGSGSGSSAQYSCLILPEILIPVDSLELSFYARLNSSTSNIRLRVGVISNPANFSTFQEVAVFTPTSAQFEEYVVDFNGCGGGYNRIAIVVVGDGTVSGSLYLDDITIDYIPACPKVRDIVVSGITTTSATISWLDNGTADAWFVDYSDQPFTDDNTDYTPRITMDNSIELTGLDSNVTYYVRIRANCGIDGTSIYSFIEFTTLPYMPTLLPFSDDFESASTYAGWVFGQSTNTNKWAIGTATNNGGSHALYVSNDNGVTNAYSNVTTATSYAFREFYFDAGRYAVSFDWKCDGESTYDYMRVFLVPVSTDLSNLSVSTVGAPSGCVSVDGNSKLNINSTWQHKMSRVDVATTGIYRLVFYWKNDNSQGSNPPAAIDNLIIAPSNCPAPTNLNITPGEGTEVTLTWDGPANATSWIVTAGNREMNPTTPTCTFTNLAARTNYLFNVRAVCSVIDTSTVSTITYMTPCAIVGADGLPLVEDFEDYTASASADIDPCWVRSQSGDRYYPYVNSFYAYSGTKSLNFPGTQTCHVALPDISVSLATLQLSFYTRSLNNDGVNLEVGIMTDPSDTSTFVLVSTVVSDTVWRPATVYFNAYTGPAGRIAMRGYRLGAYIDSLVVDIARGCPVPTNINALEPGDTMAVVTWNGNSSAYRVNYRQQGSSEWIDLGTFSSATATITGLMPVTTYEVRVSGICDGQQGDWSMVATFTTAEAANGCNPVQNLTMADIGSTAARVMWNYSDTVEGVRFELRYGAAGFDVENGVYTDTIVPYRTFILDGLSSLTAYDIYCRAVCADGNRSLWAGPAAFTTIGIDAVGFDARVSLYPNPTSGFVTVGVEGANGQVRIDIVDLNGRTVKSVNMKAADGSRRIDISGLAKGAYFVRIYGDEVNSVRKLIVK